MKESCLPKSSLAAAFLIFLLFNGLGELVVNEKDFNYVFALGFILSVVNYVIIKIWNRRRRILKSRKVPYSIYTVIPGIFREDISHFRPLSILISTFIETKPS